MALKPVTPMGEMWAISCRRRLTLNYTERQRKEGKEEDRKKGRKESTLLVSPVKLLRTREVKTLIEAAAALERKYHTDG